MKDEITSDFNNPSERSRKLNCWVCIASIASILAAMPLQAASVILDEVSHAVAASSFASASGFPTIPPGPTIASPSFADFEIIATSIASRPFGSSQGNTKSDFHASGSLAENAGTWVFETDLTSRSEAISTGTTWNITTSILTISSYHFTIDDSFDYTVGGSVMLSNIGSESTTFVAGFEIGIFRTDEPSEIWSSGPFSESSLVNAGYNPSTTGTLVAGSYEFRIITSAALGGAVQGGETSSSNSQSLYSLELSAIPEPSSLLLTIGGVLSLFVRRRRSRNRSFHESEA